MKQNRAGKKDGDSDKNADRISKAVEYIEAHLNQPISLDEVAENVCLSPYYFHRLFREVTGETLNDHIHRKKMERATKALLCRPDLNITGVSEAAGFSSPANFTKAFKAYFDISPRELRNPQTKIPERTGKLYQKYGKSLDINKFHPQALTRQTFFTPEQLESMLNTIEIREQPEKHIIFCSHYGQYDPEQMNETRKKILHWAQNHGIDTDKSRYLRVHDGNPIVRPEHQCRFDAAIEVDEPVEVSPPCLQRTLAAGLFAIAPYEGPPEHLIHFYKEIYYGWLPLRGFNSTGILVTSEGDYCENTHTLKITLYLRLEKMTLS